MSATATTTTNLDTIGKIAIKFKRYDPFEIYDSIKDLRDSIRIRKKKRSKLILLIIILIILMMTYILFIVKDVISRFYLGFQRDWLS